MKKIKILLGLAAAIAGITSFGVTQASASSYTVIKTKTYTQSPVYHAKSTTKNVYLWNKSHTKKLHNLKNYPNTSWALRASVTMKHNGSNAIYYSVMSYTPTHKKTPVYGYVWHNYLTKGYNRHYSHWNNLYLRGFTSDSDYLNYIKQSPSQSLTNKVLQLFPNSQLSLNLSHYVENRDALLDLKTESNTFNKSYRDPILLTNVNQLFYHGYKDTRTESQRFQAIEKALDAAGYTASKRASLKDYQIGIYYQNAPLKDVDGYTVGLILAKPAN
ncbi:hypothetical protein IWT25_01048 [Secundilactobacillus pentosiphilus]|uniref:D-alanyl-D-alanine carboxypeptidase n=1 Tax=Secundilactobacillus pentosiphilus TaxID=1714682 RepID=A0A1Z5IVE5_9LACO|nr:hypothetical protein [Secundilactobacillus pentosiphilus]GAX05723.1 hypothetical protein IWT25_01048 [Secundilactobacillus pentosiphilus]